MNPHSVDVDDKNSLNLVATKSEESTFYHFSQNQKLLNADQYQYVFSKSQRVGNSSFTVLARKNSLGYPRLGLAISKKCAKRAVDRNHIKRILRESFRLNQHKLPSIDIIAMCKPNVLKLDNNEMRKQIETQWQFIRKKFLTTISTTDQSS